MRWDGVVPPGPAPVEPTELVAGAWQLRPWPAAHADLDEVLAERYPDPARSTAERELRLHGWERGDLLGFAVREITTGACAAEVLVRVDGHGAVVEPWARVRGGATASSDDLDATRAAVARWVGGALGLDVVS